MSVVQKLKSVLPLGDEGVTRRTYKCQECGTTFQSAKTPDRAQCTECLANNLEVKKKSPS